ncbi:retrovirus-related pol polyprotein from transposon TNT 1-94 [Tanacetum coccineum]
MQKEIQALENNNTWDLTSLPANKSPIGCKWVFRIKYLVDGTIERFKARLVAKGFTQTKGVDYKESFAPVAKMVTLRAILALEVHKNWSIQQLDINNAFLHMDLHEEVYMSLPQGYSKSLPPGIVCKLKKSLYGLKQTSRQWFTKLSTFLLNLNFKQSYADTSLFTLNQGEHMGMLLIYVDDILLVRDFQILLRKYALDLLQQANVLNDKPYITPLNPVTYLNDTDGDLFSKQEASTYRTLVGKLIYHTITRLDLSFAAQMLSQFSHQPRTPHQKALLRVLHYIKLCPGQVLYFHMKNSL